MVATRGAKRRRGNILEAMFVHGLAMLRFMTSCRAQSLEQPTSLAHRAEYTVVLVYERAGRVEFYNTAGVENNDPVAFDDGVQPANCKLRHD